MDDKTRISGVGQLQDPGLVHAAQDFVHTADRVALEQGVNTVVSGV